MTEPTPAGSPAANKAAAIALALVTVVVAVVLYSVSAPSAEETRQCIAARAWRCGGGGLGVGLSGLVIVGGFSMAARVWRNK